MRTTIQCLASLESMTSGIVWQVPTRVIPRM